MFGIYSKDSQARDERHAACNVSQITKQSCSYIYVYTEYIWSDQLKDSHHQAASMLGLDNQGSIECTYTALPYSL